MITTEAGSRRQTDFLSKSQTSWWASLVAQSVKNLPAVQETQVGSLGWEDSLEEGTATHSIILQTGENSSWPSYINCTLQ